MKFDGPDTPEAHEAFLRQHEPLRDLLAPMLDGEVDAETDEAIGDDLVRGREIGDYRLVCEVGRGGMGIVWEATQMSLDRRVAVKLLPESFTFSARAIARFRREATVMGRFDHPGLVRVLDVGQSDSLFWFAMEFVEGDSLHERIQKRTYADAEGVEQLVELGARVAEALAHAHGHGVIHRDVKPANILVRADGGPVLTDFGLAHETGLPGMTATGAFAGTPQYVSPEQAEGRAVDARSDVFSLGATLYEAVTGDPPFDAPSVREILHRIQTNDPKDPRHANPHVSSDLAAVLSRALEKNPDRRYQTASDFAADLRCVLDGRPVIARPIGTASRLWRAARREPVKASLVLLIVFATPVITGLAGFLMAKQHEIEVGERSLREQRFEAGISEGFQLLNSADRVEAKELFQGSLAEFGPTVEAILGLVLASGFGTDLAEIDAMLAPYQDFLDSHADLEVLLSFVTKTSSEEDLARDTPVTSESELVRGSIALERALRRRDRALAGVAYEHLTNAIALSARPRHFHHVRRAHAAGFSSEPDKVAAATASLRAHWPDLEQSKLAIGYALSFTDPDASYAVLEPLAKSRSTDARLLIDLGLIAVKRRQLEDAERWFRAAIAAEPRAADAHSRLGVVLLSRGATDEGIASLERAIDLDPLLEHPHSRLGYRAARANDHATALPHFEAAAKARPEDPLALHNVAISLMKLGRHEEAIPILRRELELAPDEFLAWANLADCLERADDFAGCIAALHEAGRIRPDEIWVWWTMGKKARSVEPATAIMALGRAAALQPDNPRIHDYTGIALGKLGRWHEARAAYERALELGPELVEGYRKGCSFDLEKGGHDRLMRARVTAEAVLAATPDCAWAHEALVAACRALDDTDGVRAELHRWTEVQPDLATAWADLAEHLVAEHLPETRRAPSAARAAVARGLAATSITEADRKRLAELEAELRN